MELNRDREGVLAMEKQRDRECLITMERWHVHNGATGNRDGEDVMERWSLVIVAIK